MIASVQTDDCQRGVRHLPDGGDRIHHSLGLIHDHVDQVVFALERERHRSMLVFEPGLVAELDGMLIAQGTLAAAKRVRIAGGRGPAGQTLKTNDAIGRMAAEYSARRTSDFASSAAMQRSRGHGVPICQVLLHL